MSNRHRRNSTDFTLSIRFAISTVVERLYCTINSVSPILCVAVVAFALQSTVSRAATPAESFVQQNIESGYAILNDTSIAPGTRGEQFRALLARIMDSKRVAVFTLGSYARDVSNTQLDDFSGAFADFVTSVLQHDLAGDPGETLTVAGSIVRAPDDVIVNARLVGSARANNRPINVGFRIRKDLKGTDTLVDLQVEGVSMAMAQRSDFTSWLQQHHGDINGLIKELRTRVQQFRDDEKGHAASRPS